MASKSKEAPNAERQCKFVNPETKLRCSRELMAHELCWTHYQQERRGRPLSPIRLKGGLKLLQGNVRVPEFVEQALRARVEAKRSRSMYEATRQALEAGVAAWQKADAKAAKKAG
jgi:hypothetical protein